MKKVISVFLVLALLLCSFSVCAAAEQKTFKNVILMIGDGMGENTLKLAKQERGITLFMEENCDVRGYSQTRSHNKEVTDSAAGGTALACGVRTNNSCVAVFHNDKNGLISVPRTLAEAALLSGRRSGVITTDTNDGATPSAFTAHTSNRGNSEDICTQQATSGFDLIWGAASSDFDAALAEENGFKVIRTKDEMNALESGTRSFGQFDYNTTWHLQAPEGSTSPVLSEMTAKAIAQLTNENGFFLMVEGAHIDKNSHSNLAAECAEAVEEFDNAIETAVEFAEKDGDTLVVITADHETGGIQLNDEGVYAYTQGSHSAANVPVIVFGDKDFIGSGEAIENREVSQRLGKAMGLSEELFPAEDDGKLPIFWQKVCDFFASLWQRIRGFFTNLLPAEVLA